MIKRDKAYSQRYGEVLTLASSLWNGTLETLLAHRSIRVYEDKTLEAGTLELLIAAAQSAASSSNLQAWSVVAVEDAERKKRLAQYVGGQKHVAQCPIFLVWLADLARLQAVADSVATTAEALPFTEMFVLAVIDAALAAQNAVIAAESLGLGSVYIGGIRNQPLQVAEELKLPPQVFPVFGLCLGYPKGEAQVKPRLPQSAVLHRETYDNQAWQPAVHHYDRIMAKFYQDHHMKVQGTWSQHSSDRIKGSESLSGRHLLRDKLTTLGFPLH
jgi:nitroreductase